MCCNILILIYYIVIFNSYFVTYTAIYIYIIYAIVIVWSFSECASLIAKLHSSLFLIHLSCDVFQNKITIMMENWKFIWGIHYIFDSYYSCTQFFLSELIHKNYYVHLFVIKESIRKTRLSLNFESLILRSSILQYVFCVILFLCDFCSIFLINFELLTWKTKLSMK